MTAARALRTHAGVAGLEPAYRVVVQTLMAGGHYSLADVDALAAWRESTGLGDEQHTRVRRCAPLGRS